MVNRAHLHEGSTSSSSRHICSSRHRVEARRAWLWGSNDKAVSVSAKLPLDSVASVCTDVEVPVDWHTEIAKNDHFEPVNEKGTYKQRLLVTVYSSSPYSLFLVFFLLLHVVVSLCVRVCAFVCAHMRARICFCPTIVVFTSLSTHSLTQPPMIKPGTLIIWLCVECLFHEVKFYRKRNESENRETRDKE